MRIEAENKELILRSKEGHVAIIPVTHRKQVLKHLEEGNDKALNKLIQGLPLMSDYAEDGILISGDPLVDNLGASMGAKAKGAVPSSTPIYDDKGTLGSTIKKTVSKNLQENLNPFSYTNAIGRFLTAGVMGIKESNREQLESTASREITSTRNEFTLDDPLAARNRLDLYNVYGNKPQKYNTITKSNFKPESSKDPNSTYYKVNDPDYYKLNTQNIPQYKKTLEEIEGFKTKYNLKNSDIAKHQELFSKYSGIVSNDMEGNTAGGGTNTVNAENKLKAKQDILKIFPGMKDKEIESITASLSQGRFNPKTGGIAPSYEGNVMANHFITLGKDDRGDYWSYYDKWDMAPTGKDTNWGTPPELYDRIYYKDTEQGVSQSHLTDEEFNTFDFNSKNADLESMQKELMNKGFYKDEGKDYRVMPYKTKSVDELKSKYEEYKQKLPALSQDKQLPIRQSKTNKKH
jgi:hypothetical protein